MSDGLKFEVRTVVYIAIVGRPKMVGKSTCLITLLGQKTIHLLHVNAKQHAIRFLGCKKPKVHVQGDLCWYPRLHFGWRPKSY